MAGSPSYSNPAGYRTPLTGSWTFRVDPLKEGIASQWFARSASGEWNPVSIPGFWETLPEMEAYDGWGWFRTTFQKPPTNEPVSIHFEGVDDDAVVWLNGTEVGRHTGYSDPFSVDITAALRDGSNELTVLVDDHGGGGGIYGPVTLIETAHADDLLRSEFYGTTAIESAEWVRRAVIYEVYLRSFSPEGTFRSLQLRLRELKDLGVTVIWLMPIHPIGKEKRKGTLGSPYSISDYYAANPEFGTIDDFRSLVDAVHHEGMKIIIDLVINHTAWDNPLLKDHPEWYSKDKAGTIISPNADWTDVADLDFSQPALRDYLLEMMVYWVKDVGIDGYRCDVAELIPTDFWEEARRRLDLVKPVMMLSEGTLPEHHRAAFDLTYSWSIYDILEDIADGSASPSVLDGILKRESLQFPVGSLRLRFNSNHDKNAWDAPAPLKFTSEDLKLTTVLVSTMPGVPLIYNGQEIASERRLDLLEKVEIDWEGSSEMRSLYRELLHLRKNEPAFIGTEMKRVESPGDDRVFAFIREGAGRSFLIVLNFSDHPTQGSLVLPPESPEIIEQHGTELFTGEQVVVRTGEPARIVLGPKEFCIYRFETAPRD